MQATTVFKKILWPVFRGPARHKRHAADLGVNKEKPKSLCEILLYPCFHLIVGRLKRPAPNTVHAPMAGAGVFPGFVFLTIFMQVGSDELVGLDIPLRSIFKPPWPAT